MTSYSDMTLEHVLTFNYVNLDQLTETYSPGFYIEYMTHWPEYQRIATHPLTGVPMGYSINKAEGKGEDFHGHVSALTVAPAFRRLGLGNALMKDMEDTTSYVYNAYFVDLFVRRSNTVAISLYERLHYIIYRTVLKYYLGDKNHHVKNDEDAFDMRRAMPRNACRSKSSVIPMTRAVKPEELQWN